MIDKEEFEKASFKEKQKFIIRLVTHNSFSKDDLLFLIKWQNAIIEKAKCCFNCDNYLENPDICDSCKKYSNWELVE